MNSHTHTNRMTTVCLWDSAHQGIMTEVPKGCNELMVLFLQLSKPTVIQIYQTANKINLLMLL